MTDTLRSEDGLRDLLHRAVDELTIEPVVDLPTTEPLRPAAGHSRSDSRGPWLVAAAVVVIAALGAGWWVSGPGGETIDVGPAALAPADRVDSDQLQRVVEESGIWRLPDRASGFTVTEVMESSARMPLQIAVDDPDSPTELLAIIPGSYSLAGQPDATAPAPFTEKTTSVFLGTDEPGVASWLEVTGEGRAGYLTFVYIGLDDRTIEAVARSLVEEIGGSSGSLTDSGRVGAALGGFRPPDGLVATWDPSRVGIGSSAYDPTGPITSIGLRVTGSGNGERSAVSIRETSLPRAVAMAWGRIQATSPAIAPTTDVNGAPRQIEERPDLGQGVLVATLDGVDTATLFTDDGTEITAQSDPSSAQTTFDRRSLTVDQQLELIRSLRATSESEFSAALDAMGISVSSADEGATTTTTGG